MATPLGAASPAFSPPPHALNSPAQAPTPRASASLAIARRVAHSTASQVAPSGRSVSAAGAVSGVALEDARVEVARTLALLGGVDGAGGGEVGRLVELLESSRTAYEFAFEEGAAPPPPPQQLLASLANLHRLLKNSPLGALPLNTESEAESAAEDVPAAVAKTSAGVQSLFRQRQRAKEGAEIVASVLSAA